MYTQTAEVHRAPLRHPETFLANPESGSSIFNFYSIPNEIALLKNIYHLPQKEKEFYVRENVVRFVDEFVGKVPYTQISYINDGGALTFGGIPVRNAYRKAARLAGDGSREQFETDGFERIHDFLAQSTGKGKEEKKIAWWISPSKTADYGFVFMFVDDHSPGLEKQIVREYVLRYSEPLGSVARSNQVLSAIGGNMTDFRRPEEFLQQPLLKHSLEPSEDVARTLHTLGIDTQLIAQSHQFDQLARTKLAPWIDLYTQGIIRTANELNQNNLSLVEQKVIVAIREAELKTILTAIYTMAEEIKKNIVSGTFDTIENSMTPRPYQNKEEFIAAALVTYGYDKQAVVTGGGSCPVTKQTDDDFLSNGDLHALLRRDIPLEQSLQKEHHVCTVCGKDSKDNHYHCPSCQHSFSDETERSSDKRTKQCNCGLKFSC